MQHVSTDSPTTGVLATQAMYASPTMAHLPSIVGQSAGIMLTTQRSLIIGEDK